MTSLDARTTVAGRYVTGELLGRGGMGEVYDAVDLRLDRPVALKRLRTDLAHDRSMRRRVEAEARLAAKLSHPHVVTVFDSGVDAGHPFIVMERLEGRTLRDELAPGPLDQESVRSMAAQVLDALEAAHGIGLIHRDVKPGNILVAGVGSWKVADFGIATSTGDDHTITNTGELLGSAPYLAPERLEGRAATARSDLYSLGVVMYEAFSGRPPFGEGSPIELAMRIRDGRCDPLLEISPYLDPALAAVVARAMSADPSNRFATAAEMAAMLAEGNSDSASGAATEIIERPSDPTAILEPIPDAVRGPGSPRPERDGLAERAPAGPTGRPARRPSMRAIVVAALMLAVVAIAVVLLVKLAGSSDTTRPAPAPTRSTVSGTPAPAPLQKALDRLQESITP